MTLNFGYFPIYLNEAVLLKEIITVLKSKSLLLRKYLTIVTVKSYAKYIFCNADSDFLTYIIKVLTDAWYQRRKEIIVFTFFTFFIIVVC